MVGITETLRRQRLPLATLLIAVTSAGATGLAARPVQTSEQITFQHGDVTLAGTLYLPAQLGRHPAVIAFHAANGGTRDYHAYQHLAKELPAAGFAVLLFDRRGEGASSGVASTATFTDLAGDGVAGISYLKRRPDIDPLRIGVWGVSQGGWLAPLAATMSPDIAFVIAVSAPGVTPARQMDYTARYALHAAGEPPDVADSALRVRAIVNDYYRGRAQRGDAERAIGAIRSKPWFSQVSLPNAGNLPDDPAHTKWRAQMDYDPLVAVAHVQVPMAFFYAQTDAYVPVPESMTGVRRAARYPDVSMWRVPGTDHYMETGTPLSAGPTSKVYVRHLLAWLRRHGGKRIEASG